MSQVHTLSRINTYTGHKDSVYTLEALDEYSFCSAGSDGMVIRWDLRDQTKGKMMVKVPSSIYALAYDGSTRELFVGQNFEGIHIVDVEKKEEARSLKLTKAAIFDIKLDSKYIFIASGDGVLHVVDRVSLAVVHRSNPTEKSARAIALVGSRIFVGYSDNCMREFDRLNFTMIQEIEAHKISVFTLCPSPDSQYLLSGSRDAHLKVWDLKNMSVDHDIVAHMFAINHIAYSRDGRHFVTCSMDKSIKVWDSTTFKLIKVIDKARHAGHATSVNKLLWMPFNDLLVSCSDDNSVSVWDIKFDK